MPKRKDKEMTPTKLDFETYYEPPTREFVWNALTYGLRVDATDDLVAMQTLRFGDAIPPSLLRNRNRLVVALIQFSYQRKRQLLRIPFVGHFALFIRNRMNEQSLASNDPDFPRLDLSSILMLETDDFLEQLYMEALGRPPDPDGKDGYKRAIELGTSKEAVAYLIFSSDEFGGRAQIVDFQRYRKAYRQYRIRELFRELPALSWMLTLKGRSQRNKQR
jgi:hypothetical protein